MLYITAVIFLKDIKVRSLNGDVLRSSFLWKYIKVHICLQKRKPPLPQLLKQASYKQTDQNVCLIILKPTHKWPCGTAPDGPLTFISCCKVVILKTNLTPVDQGKIIE